MASTDLSKVKDSKYGNYMTEATHVMDAMRGFGLSMNKIGTAIQQNNVKQTIIKHMVPHVQKHLESIANQVSQKVQDTAHHASQKLSEMANDSDQSKKTDQPQGETEVLEPQQ